MIDINLLPPRNTKKNGSIVKRKDNLYVITKNNKYYCSCVTYEQAYYVRQELIKCNWDKDCLNAILENYPVYYTDLLEFYRYVTVNNASYFKWCISIPSKHSDNGVTQQIRCTNIEDALYERDFLVKHDWDYELLVYTIDDTSNPYYDVELPPYPERKIRNISVQDTHEKELTQIIEWLKETPKITQRSLCERLGVSDMTIRNWLSKYHTNWREFKQLVRDGINPLDVLTMERHIYTPDLSVPKPPSNNFKGYIYNNSRSKKNPYGIMYKHKKYGCYPTRELAEKIMSELKKCNWDRKQLPRICSKYDYTPVMSKDYVYRNNNDSFSVRKNINGKLVTFGTFGDYEVACRVRDIFKEREWNVEDIEAVYEEVMLELGGK